MKKNYEPGSQVFILERDKNGEAVDVSGYMFVAQVGDYAIATPYINDLETIEETMEYHKDDTAEYYHCDLSVFPLAGCHGVNSTPKVRLASRFGKREINIAFCSSMIYRFSGFYETVEL